MISIIIPALNEERALPATLANLFAQPGNFEAILVDGGSHDATLSVAADWPLLQVMSASPGRAVQMNAGAAKARGDVLLFLHADTLLPEEALLRLTELEAEVVLWGGFHQQFSSETWALGMVSSLHNWRCKQTGVFYGDQAMFVSREMFERAGGFPAEPILEDIRLSEVLLQQAQPVFLAEHVITDARKFEQMGPLRSFLRCMLILICFELRLPVLGQRFFSAIR